MRALSAVVKVTPPDLDQPVGSRPCFPRRLPRTMDFRGRAILQSGQKVVMELVPAPEAPLYTPPPSADEVVQRINSGALVVHPSKAGLNVRRVQMQMCNIQRKHHLAPGMLGQWLQVYEDDLQAWLLKPERKVSKQDQEGVPLNERKAVQDKPMLPQPALTDVDGSPKKKTSSSSSSSSSSTSSSASAKASRSASRKASPPSSPKASPSTSPKTSPSAPSVRRTQALRECQAKVSEAKEALDMMKDLFIHALQNEPDCSLVSLPFACKVLCGALCFVLYLFGAVGVASWEHIEKLLTAALELQ